jgi:hypothetical protein
MKKIVMRSMFLALVVILGLTGCTAYGPPASVGVGVGVGPGYYGYGGYYPYRPYFYRPPVVVAPRPYYRVPGPRFYGGGRGYWRGGRRW